MDVLRVLLLALFVRYSHIFIYFLHFQNVNVFLNLIEWPSFSLPMDAGRLDWLTSVWRSLWLWGEGWLGPGIQESLLLAAACSCDVFGALYCSWEWSHCVLFAAYWCFISRNPWNLRSRCQLSGSLQDDWALTLLRVYGLWHGALRHSSIVGGLLLLWLLDLHFLEHHLSLGLDLLEGSSALALFADELLLYLGYSLRYWWRTILALWHIELRLQPRLHIFNIIVLWLCWSWHASWFQCLKVYLANWWFRDFLGSMALVGCRRLTVIGLGRLLDLSNTAALELLIPLIWRSFSTHWGLDRRDSRMGAADGRQSRELCLDFFLDQLCWSHIKLTFWLLLGSLLSFLSSCDCSLALIKRALSRSLFYAWVAIIMLWRFVS